MAKNNVVEKNTFESLGFKAKFLVSEGSKTVCFEHEKNKIRFLIFSDGAFSKLYFEEGEDWTPSLLIYKEEVEALQHAYKDLEL